MLLLGPFHSLLFQRWFRFPFAWIMRCRRRSRRPGLFYVLQIFLWTSSFRVNIEIDAWSTVRRILWRFLTCIRHALFFNVKELSWLRIACDWFFERNFAGKAYLKINLLVKTPLRSAVWKLDAPGYGLLTYNLTTPPSQGALSDGYWMIAKHVNKKNAGKPSV